MPRRPTGGAMPTTSTPGTALPSMSATTWGPTGPLSSAAERNPGSAGAAECAIFGPRHLATRVIYPLGAQLSVTASPFEATEAGGPLSGPEPPRGVRAGGKGFATPHRDGVHRG